MATTQACEKFNDYILGKDIIIEADHKRLVPLLGTKLLDQLPPTVQTFKMRLMKYSFVINHIPGKELVTAGALSRALIRKPPTEVNKRLTEDLNLYVVNIFKTLPASEWKLEEVRLHQQDDEVCRKRSEFCTEAGQTELNRAHLFLRIGEREVIYQCKEVF